VHLGRIPYLSTEQYEVAFDNFPSWAGSSSIAIRMQQRFDTAFGSCSPAGIHSISACLWPMYDEQKLS
jgi:hypothetical protein